MQNIVIIGSEKGLLISIAQSLEDTGFQVKVCSPNPELLESLSAGCPDVLIIDLASAGDHFELERLSSSGQGQRFPIVGLISHEQLSNLDITVGLDDFVLRSASPDEVTARVRQVLLRNAHVNAKDIVRCGELTIDLANYTVYVNDHPVGLTYKEYELLRFLATHPNQVCNRQTLLNEVWGYDFYGGDRTVDVHIRRLRSKIEDSQHTFIETVRNVGYRFHAF